MLKALYDYAVSHELSLPDGYVRKTVAAYITFSTKNQEYVGIRCAEKGQEWEISCPDIGSLANSKEKSNIIVEKRSVVIPDAPNAKSNFFRQALEKLGTLDADAMCCVERLSSSELIDKINQLLDENKIKPANRISFMVDGYMCLPHLCLYIGRLQTGVVIKVPLRGTILVMMRTKYQTETLQTTMRYSIPHQITKLLLHTTHLRSMAR